MRSATEIQAEITALSALILEVLEAGPYKSITRAGRGYTIHDLGELRRMREALESELAAQDPRSCRTYVHFGRPGGFA
jgi:hypothetical protein